MKILFLIFAILTCSFSSHSQSTQKRDDLTVIIEEFLVEMKGLKIPEFDLSFQENLKRIPNLENINNQAVFFEKYFSKLQSIDRNILTRDQVYQYDVLAFEIRLNLERLALEKQLKENSTQDSYDGLFHLPNSKQWYAFYIKKWTSTEISPEDVFDYGVGEVNRIVAEYRNIQEKLGYKNKDEAFYAHLNSPSFLITKEPELLKKFQATRKLAQKNLKEIFETTNIPSIAIKPILNSTKDSPPGYYTENTFYYNFFGDKFSERNIDWLYIHEAVPGHHYETSISNINQFPLLKRFFYSGYSEGWAAYMENLGKDLGFYQDPYQQLGKWEWDMVRSVRLPMDVGLNYLGWTKQQALDFWKKYIPNQDSIAMREIDRIIRWPVQVMSYKLGERAILKLKNDCQKKLGPRFNVRKFHSNILKNGNLPLPILENNFSC